ERAGREKYDAQRSSANTNDLRGKILRIHPEAAGRHMIAAGNLFAPCTVLATADEPPYDAGGAKRGAAHPISWGRNAEGGKVWAPAMGHETASYSEPFFRQHLLGGLK
ncbi:ThuA domain-containing protein, partial [Streptomyces viridochromogenes]